MPIIIPRLDDPESASADERDEHLMLLEAARHELDVEWAGTLAAFDRAADHDLFGYPSTVAYLKHRMRMAGGRAHRYVKTARSILRHVATFRRGVTGSSRRTKPKSYSPRRNVSPTCTQPPRQVFSSSPVTDSTRRDAWWLTGATRSTQGAHISSSKPSWNVGVWT